MQKLLATDSKRRKREWREKALYVIMVEEEREKMALYVIMKEERDKTQKWCTTSRWHNGRDEEQQRSS
jgi:hypothetical protein